MHTLVLLPVLIGFLLIGEGAQACDMRIRRRMNFMATVLNTKLNLLLLHTGPSMYQLLLLDTFSSWAELLISQYCI